MNWLKSRDKNSTHPNSIREGFITTRQAASLLPQYSSDYIARLIREGIIPGCRVHNRWYVERGALLNWSKDRARQDMVRSERISFERQQEVEVKQFAIVVPENASTLLTHLRSFAIFSVGLLAGVGVFLSDYQIANVRQLGDESFQLLASTVAGYVGKESLLESKTNHSLTANMINAEQLQTQTVALLHQGAGIVLLQESGISLPATLFSDDVVVVSDGFTGGVIYIETQNGQSSTSIPFVSLPPAP